MEANWTETKDKIKIYLDRGSSDCTPDKKPGGLCRDFVLYFKWDGSEWFRANRYFNTNSEVGLRQHLEEMTLESLKKHIRCVAVYTRMHGGWPK